MDSLVKLEVGVLFLIGIFMIGKFDVLMRLMFMMFMIGLIGMIVCF